MTPLFSVEENKQQGEQGEQGECGAMVVANSSKPRFVQLYTSKMFESRRAELVNPPEEEEEDDDDDDDDDANKIVRAGQRRGGNNDPHLEEHVLSPRLVDAISKTAQVVWATTKKQEGLIGRSDIRLQTAVGMPVAVDAHGNMCIVVMFSPNNIQSTDDAMEYLQAISESATSSNIPCLYPVFDSRLGYHNLSMVHHHNAYHPGAGSLGEGVTARFVSLDDGGHAHRHHNHFPRSLPLALCDEPEVHSDHELSTAPKDVFGIPMLPAFAELDGVQGGTTSNNYNNNNKNGGGGGGGGGGADDDDDDDADAFDEATHGIWTTIMESLDNGEMPFFDLQPENESALVSDEEQQQQQQQQQSGQSMEQTFKVNWKDEAAPMTDSRKLRLEEFCSAFLGMSVFDLADVWVPAGDDYPDSLRHVMSITSANMMLTHHLSNKSSNPNAAPPLNHFRTVSESTLIKCWAGAVGTAFSSGNPVWSANPRIFADPGRYDAFQIANFQTVLAVPVFSHKQVMPACVVSCYSFVRSTSVPFVLRFVQQALRLLWEGLDKITPHDSVVGGIWKNVAPADLGEMAADMEMHEHFIKKKRSHDLISVEPSKPLDPLTNQMANQFQAIELPNGDMVALPLQIAEITTAAEQAATADATAVLPMTNHIPLQPAEFRVVQQSTLQNHLFEAVRSVADAKPFEHVNTNSEGSKRAHVMGQQQQKQQPGPLGPPPPLAFRPLAMPQALPTKIVGGSSSSSLNSISSSLNQANGSGVYRNGLLLQQPQQQQQHQQQQQQLNMVPIVFAAPMVLQNQPAPIEPSSHSFQKTQQMFQTQQSAATTAAPSCGGSPYGFVAAAFHLPSSNTSHISTAPNSTQFCVPVAANNSQHHVVDDAGSLKPCRIQGCSELALSRRPYCEKHSGNRSCEHAGCNKCAQGSTRFCIAHGGGRRCTFPGCDKGARDKMFCAAHGGGKRCKHDGCNKSAVGGSSLCTAHGGGKRCSVVGCDKSAQSSTQFCVKHGGGKKCLHVGCEKVARGRTMYCAAHGGGVRCKLEGCNRVAIGKMQLCRAHGGGSLARKGDDDSPVSFQHSEDSFQEQTQQQQQQQQPMSFLQPPMQQMQPAMIGIPTGHMSSV
jgi:hypothetical protein